MTKISARKGGFLLQKTTLYDTPGGVEKSGKKIEKNC